MSHVRDNREMSRQTEEGLTSRILSLFGGAHLALFLSKFGSVALTLVLIQAKYCYQ